MLRSSSKQTRPQPAPYRPRLEGLEDRCLLAAGALDSDSLTGFGPVDPATGLRAGFVTTHIGATDVYSNWATAVAVQQDGTPVVEGVITIYVSDKKK